METISIKDIKQNYPDEWILLGNPEMDKANQSVLSGVLLYHSRDKKEVGYLGKPMTANYKKTALFFNRATPRKKRNVMASLFYPINQ